MPPGVVPTMVTRQSCTCGARSNIRLRRCIAMAFGKRRLWNSSAHATRPRVARRHGSVPESRVGDTAQREQRLGRKAIAAEGVGHARGHVGVRQPV